MTNVWKLVLCVCLLVSGCSSDSSTTQAATPGTVVPPAASTGNLRGVVQSGGTSAARPLVGAQVTLFEAGPDAPRQLGAAITDSDGRFALTAPLTRTNGTFYLAARLGPGVTLLTVAGPSLPSTVTINELTTVAAAWSMAQFYRGGEIRGPELSLRIAAGMNDNLVSPVTGTSSDVLLTSPNADQTNSLRSTRSLANFLASGLQQPDEILQLTGATDTAQGLANLARNPARNVAQIYTRSKLVEPFQPGLARQPDAWTLCVKVNQTGNLENLWAGPGNLVFDDQGNAWITNNVVQGTGKSGQFAVVLQPNGKPAAFSPLTSGGLLGGGFGVDIDSGGRVWFSNFGWGGVDPAPGGNGSLSIFTGEGNPITGPTGLQQGGVVRCQDIAIDGQDNVWVASFENNRLVVFPKGDPARAFFSQQASGSGPFDILLNGDGTAWMSNSGGLFGQNQSTLAHFTLLGDTLREDFKLTVGKALKGMAGDRLGNVWQCSQNDSTIYAFSSDGSPLGSFSGGSLDGPWGAAVDGDQHVWIANFGSLRPGSNFLDTRITQLCGADPATQPPGRKLGDQLSPPTGYTLPSAGEQVLMANGVPLYGPGAAPNFTPLQRLTAVQIDRAGNIWCCNNFKPNIDVDFTSNPGGDGMVIFVGLARPPLQP